MANLQTLSTMTIPEWLKDSFFFENLDHEVEFTIDSQFFRETTEIKNLDDFMAVIRVMSFWSVNKIPLSVKEAVESDMISGTQFFDMRNLFPTLGETIWDILDILSAKFIGDLHDFKKAYQAVIHFGLQENVPWFVYEFVSHKYYDVDCFQELLLTLDDIRFSKKMLIISSNSTQEAILQLCQTNFYDALDYMCSIASDFDKRSIYQEVSSRTNNPRNMEILNKHGITLQFENIYIL